MWEDLMAQAKEAMLVMRLSRYQATEIQLGQEGHSKTNDWNWQNQVIKEGTEKLQKRLHGAHHHEGTKNTKSQET